MTGESSANAASQDHAPAVPEARSLQEGNRFQQGGDVLPGGQSANVQEELCVETITGSHRRRLGCSQRPEETMVYAQVNGVDLMGRQVQVLSDITISVVGDGDDRRCATGYQRNENLRVP